MVNMKLVLILCIVLGNLVLAQSVSGEVIIKGGNPKGVLYVFAKRFGGEMPMPLAVMRIANPKFPVKFELSQKNAMIKDTPFKGPFMIVARLSPSGDAFDKSGMEVSTTKKIELGEKDIKLVLAK